MVMAHLLLFDPAFSHRCQTKDQLREDSSDKVKVDLVTTDTFARLEDCLNAIKGDPSRYVYNLAPSRKLSEDIGRLYDTRFVSFMYMSKKIRNPLYYNMVECDQKSAHPRIFVELFKGIIGKTPEIITKIINNKDELYPELASKMQCSVTDIKKIVNATMYGSESIDTIFGKNNGRRTPKILDDFREEVGRVLSVVTVKYHDQYNILKKKNPTYSEYKLKRTTLSYVLSEVEAAISSCALLLMIDWGWVQQDEEGVVASFLHDGIYIKKHLSDEKLDKLSKEVSRRVGFRVDFGCKTVDPYFTPDELKAIENARQPVDPGETKKMLAKLAFGDTEHTVVVKQAGVGKAIVTMEVRDPLTGTLFPVSTKYYFTTDGARRHHRAALVDAKKDSEMIFGEEVEVSFQIATKNQPYVVRPSVGSDQPTMTLLKASMNGGKSYGSQSSYFQHGECIFIAPTISLTSSFRADTNDRASKHSRPIISALLGLDRLPNVSQSTSPPTSPSASPRDIKHLTLYSTDKDFDPMRCCTTVNSLGMVRRKLKNGQAPKLVVVDEASKVIEALTSDTMDKSPDSRIDALKALKYLVANAQEVHILDADMTKYEADFFRKLRPDGMVVKPVYFASPDKALDFRFTGDIRQTYSLILQSAFVNQLTVGPDGQTRLNTPLVVPCSTVKEVVNVQSLLLDYANGKVNLYASKVKRSAEHSICELMQIHCKSREDIIKFIKSVITGTVTVLSKTNVKVPSDMRPDVISARESLFNQGEAVSFNKKYRCVFNPEDDGHFYMKLFEKSCTIEAHILVYSPCVSVGLSFNTCHYKLCVALFPNTEALANVLGQMTNRFRAIRVITIYAGSSSSSCKDITKMEEQADEFIRRVAGRPLDRDMSDEFKDIYRHQLDMKQGQAKICLKEALTRAILHSNPFNTVRELPNDPAVVSSAGVPDMATLDVDNSAVYSARDITEEEYCQATPEQQAKFNMVNRVFQDQKIPPSLSTESIKTWVNHYPSFKFMRRLLDPEKFEEVNTPALNTWGFIGNRASDEMDFTDLCILLRSIGFTSGSHFVDWTNRKSGKTFPIGALKEDEDTVKAVVERHGLFKDAKKKKFGVADKSLRCVTHLLERLCPCMGEKVTKGDSIFHGERFRFKYCVDNAAIDFLNGFVKGVTVQYTPKIKGSRKSTCRDSQTILRKAQKSEIGTLGRYRGFQ